MNSLRMLTGFYRNRKRVLSTGDTRPEVACHLAWQVERARLVGRSAAREGRSFRCTRNSGRNATTGRVLVLLVCLFALSASADSWPTFHGDFSLSGHSASKIPQKPKLLWRYQAEQAITTTPVANDQYIYVTTEMGNVHALSYNGKHGMARFKGKAPMPIILHTVVAAYLDGTVKAIDGLSGRMRWTQSLDGPIKSTPVVHRDKNPVPTLVILSQSSGALSAFDLLTGKPRWQQAGPERADGHLALSDNTLVFGSCAAAIHTVPVAGGQAVSSIPLGEGAEIAGGVATYMGRAYTGNRGGSIVAADLSSRTNLWINDEWTGELFTTPALDGKHLVVVNGYGSIACLDLATGKRLWLNEAEAVDAKSIVITGDSVVASMDGTLVILSLSDGKERWRFEISDEITSPAIVNGLILVGTDEGQVLAFGE